MAKGKKLIIIAEENKVNLGCWHCDFEVDGRSCIPYHQDFLTEESLRHCSEFKGYTIKSIKEEE